MLQNRSRLDSRRFARRIMTQHAQGVGRTFGVHAPHGDETFGVNSGLDDRQESNKRDRASRVQPSNATGIPCPESKRRVVCPRGTGPSVERSTPSSIQCFASLAMPSRLV